METEAESWFCEDSVASASKLSIAESHDTTLFNFGIEVTQIDSKEPILSEEDSEVDKLDRIMNIVDESDNEKGTSDGEVSFSLSMLEANAQAQRETGLADQTKDKQVIEEYADVEVTNLFLWQGSQAETEGVTEEEIAPASNVVPNQRKESTTIEEEEVGLDITSIFMWDENKFVDGNKEENNEVAKAAVESSLETLKNRIGKNKEGPPEHEESKGTVSSGEKEMISEGRLIVDDCKAAKGHDAEHLETSSMSLLSDPSKKKEEDLEQPVHTESEGSIISGERQTSSDEASVDGDCITAEGHAEPPDVSSESPLLMEHDSIKTEGDLEPLPEHKEIKGPVRAEEKETACEEAIVEAANRHEAEHVDTSSQSLLIEQSDHKKEVELDLTAYSEAYETFDTQSKMQEVSSHKTHESIVASGFEDFVKGLFAVKSESDIEVDDRYDIPEPASSESEVNESDKYTVTSDSRNFEAADDGYDVKSADSSATEHSIEVSLDARVISAEDFDATKDDGTIEDASLDKVISNDGSKERGAAHSFEGRIESSAMGTNFQSTFGDATLDSYEDTMGSTLDSNESSFYDDNAATLTSYDTSDSTIVDSSFSDDFEDPLKILDFAGCMAVTCEDENTYLSGDRRSTKKKTTQKGKSDPTSKCMAATCEDGNASLSGEQRFKKKKTTQKDKSNPPMSNGSLGVLTMLADYMKNETPFKHLAQKAVEEEPPRAPLSPSNATMKRPSIVNRKTPKHEKKIVEKESLSAGDPVVELPSDPVVEAVDPIVQDVDAPVETTSGEAGDENAPIETANTSADTSVNTGACDASVNTGADTVRAGYQSMQVRNKILSGARQKMESAMISRHQRAGITEFAALKRTNFAPRKPFPSISEEDGSKDISAIRRNRWSKPDRHFLDKKRSRRRKKHHKIGKTVATKQQ
jgi:hypothetical protein